MRRVGSVAVLMLALACAAQLREVRGNEPPPNSQPVIYSYSTPTYYSTPRYYSTPAYYSTPTSCYSRPAYSYSRPTYYSTPTYYSPPTYYSTPTSSTDATDDTTSTQSTLPTTSHLTFDSSNLTVTYRTTPTMSRRCVQPASHVITSPLSGSVTSVSTYSTATYYPTYSACGGPSCLVLVQPYIIVFVREDSSGNEAEWRKKYEEELRKKEEARKEAERLAKEKADRERLQKEGIRWKKAHVLIIADDEDPTLKPFVTKSVTQLIDTLKGQLDKDKLNLKPILASDAPNKVLTGEAVLKAVQDLEVSKDKDETLCCFYLGHGETEAGKEAKIENHLLRLSGLRDAAKGNYTLKRSKLLEEMKKKGCPLTILVTDSCANTAALDKQPPLETTPPVTGAFAGPPDRRDHLASLLLGHVGLVDVNSSKPGTKAYYDRIRGGLLIDAFMEVLLRVRVYRTQEGRCNWAGALEEMKQLTNKNYKDIRADKLEEYDRDPAMKRKWSQEEQEVYWVEPLAEPTKAQTETE